MLSDEGDGARERDALIGIDVCGVDSVPDIGGLGHGPSVYLSVPKAFGTVPMINEGATAVEYVDREVATRWQCIWNVLLVVCEGVKTLGAKRLGSSKKRTASVVS